MDDSKKLSRRSVLQHAAVLAGATLTATMIPIKRADAQKITKEAMKYQDTPMGDKQCDNCVYFVAPGSCGIVEGTVSPKGYCIGWNKKP
jgi:hypothetical protein